MATELNDSQLNMWRALVALIHVDGEKHPEEEAFFKESFEGLELSEAQMGVLMSDLESKTQVEDYFGNITEPRDRSQFIYFARIMFWCDGNFDQQEQEIHKRLTESVMSKVDLEAVMHEVDQVTEKFIEAEAKKEGSLSLRQKLRDAFMFWADFY